MSLCWELAVNGIMPHWRRRINFTEYSCSFVFLARAYFWLFYTTRFISVHVLFVLFIFYFWVVSIVLIWHWPFVGEFDLISQFLSSISYEESITYDDEIINTNVNINQNMPKCSINNFIGRPWTSPPHNTHTRHTYSDRWFNLIISERRRRGR